MHIPAIVGGALEGPVVGLLAGAIFGVFSFLSPDSPIFTYPQVAILPRLLIGIVAWAVFASLRNRNLYLASIAAGVLGSLTNSIGVLGIARLMELLNTEQIITIVPQVIAEAILAAIVTVVVVRGVLLYRSGRTTAPEIGSEEEKRY
ncbi:MAG: ECF transporter S component [Rubrobacteraceae bacterium]